MKSLAPNLSAHIPHVLLAEDDLNLRQLVALALRREGYRVMEAVDGVDAVRVLANRSLGRCALVGAVMDVRMPGYSGMSILRGLARSHDTLPVVMMTAFGDGPTHQRAHEYGARVVLDKPVRLKSLCAAVTEHFVTPVLPSPAGPERSTTEHHRGDELLVDRYLDVFNRAVIQHEAGSGPKLRGGAVVQMRVVGEDTLAPTHVLLRKAGRCYERTSEHQPEHTDPGIEVERAHLEDAIRNPWVYFAHPQRLVLWG